jgi:hypothetical protein
MVISLVRVGGVLAVCLWHLIFLWWSETPKMAVIVPRNFKLLEEVSSLKENIDFYLLPIIPLVSFLFSSKSSCL